VFITDTALNPRPDAPDADWLAEVSKRPEFAWVRSAHSELRSVRQLIDPVADRVKGYTGWLLSDPAFLEEAGRLRALYTTLPAPLRPRFPLYRPSPAVQHPRLPSFDPEVAGVSAREFGGALVRLLDRWGLRCLAAWDLPVPQGPLLPNPLPPNSPAQPRTGANLHIPTYYPVRGSDDIEAQILRIQSQAARDLGVDGSAVGLPRHEAYAQLLDVLHLERSIRARFPGPRAPRGLVNRIVAAVSDFLELEADRVQKYRKAIARCQRGDRAGVAILRVTATARRSGRP
jgi:hypothetical protein